MMTYFEVRDRLENLIEFRNLYREYLSFVNRPDNIPAQIIREKMRGLATLTVDSMRCVNLGGMLTRNAPAQGGRTVRINVIKAIFRDSVIKQFSLDERLPLEVLEKGIVQYRKLLWEQRLQLYNPIFWLFQFFGFVARLPFLFCRQAGFNTENAEQLALVRLWIIGFQAFCFYLVAESLGLIDFVAVTIFP